VRRPYVRGYENVVFFALQISNVFAAVIVYLTNSGSVSADITTILIYVLVALAGGVLVNFVAVALYAIVVRSGPSLDDVLTVQNGKHGEDLAPAEYGYEYDDDEGNGTAAAAGDAGAEFDASNPWTWLSVFGVGAGGAGVGGRRRHRRRVMTAAAVTPKAIAGRVERADGPTLPDVVDTHISHAVRERAFEPPSFFNPMLAVFGLARGSGPAPAPEAWTKRTGTGCTLVPATAQQLPAVQEILTATVVDFAGGADNQGLTHSQIEVVAASFVENPRLFASYASEVSQVRRAHHEESRAAPVLGVATVPFAEPLLGGEILADEVNECLLFHGARGDVSAVIANDGIDPRVGSTGGMFGIAAYLAENSSKADQYAEPDAEGICTLVLVRAVLGTPYIARDPAPFVKPPCRVGGHAAQPCVHPKFDSVVGEIEAHVQGAVLKRHREFCLYDRTKAYPWIIIKYRRV
jgi:hypothetical protein